MLLTVEHRTIDELMAGLAEIRASPGEEGTVQLIVIRPEKGVRTVLEQAELDECEGVVGDNWLARGSSRTSDGRSDPQKQLNVMNARAAALIAVAPDRRPLAGDQLYLDLDLSARSRRHSRSR